MGHGLSVIGPNPSFPIFYFPTFIFSFPPRVTSCPSRLKIPPLCIRSILPPILIPSVVKNVLSDPTPSFPIFYFPPFIFSFPPSRHFVPFAVKMPWSILRLLRFSAQAYEKIKDYFCSS